MSFFRHDDIVATITASSGIITEYFIAFMFILNSAIFCFVGYIWTATPIFRLKRLNLKLAPIDEREPSSTPLVRCDSLV